MLVLVFKNDYGGIYAVMILMNQDIMVLFQIVILRSEIWYFKAIVFPLVCCLIDIVIKDKYSWIFYQKFGQFCWYNPYLNLQD